MRLVGITVSILLHLVFGWLLFGPDLEWPWESEAPTERVMESARELGDGDIASPEAPRVAVGTSSASGTPRASADRPRDRSRAPDPRSDEERRGYEAGREAFDRHGVAEMQAQMHGPELAALMERPVGEAWRALAERVRAGDDEAAHALMTMAGACHAATTERPGQRDSHFESMTRGLGDFDRGYVSAYLHGEQARTDRFARECAAAGVGEQSLDSVLNERLASLGLEPFASTSSGVLQQHADFWAHFSSVFGEGTTDLAMSVSSAAQPWVERIRSGKPMSDAEFQALHQAAWDDPTLMHVLATSCAPNCRADDEPFEWIAERDRPAWQLRAAQFGVAGRTLAHANELAAAGDRIGALAWYDYARWLEFEGCFPLGVLTVQMAGAAAEPIRRGLTPAEQAAAAAQRDALVREFGPRALVLRPCPG